MFEKKDLIETPEMLEEEKLNKLVIKIIDTISENIDPVFIKKELLRIGSLLEAVIEQNKNLRKELIDDKKETENNGFSV